MADPKPTGGGDFPAISEQDELPGLVRQMARWEELQRKLQNGDRLTAQEYEEVVYLDNNLNQLMKERPDLYNKVSSSLTTLEKARGGTPGAPGSLSDGNASSSFNSTFSERSTVDRRQQQDVQQLTSRYVDLPTADEFLDDFENAYNIHLTGLVQTGAINPAVAQFARENMSQVFGEYLREQTARLLKGEPLWRVVGQNANNQLVGRRTGEFSDTDTQTAAETRENFNRTEATRSAGGATPTSPAQTGQTATGGATGGAAPASQAPAAQSAADAAAQSTLGNVVENASGTTSGSTYEDFYQREKTRFQQDEAIVSRNRLGYVANLAPLDFFKDQATAQRLNLLYGGYKGAQVRQNQTAAGGPRVQARRI